MRLEYLANSRGQQFCAKQQFCFLSLLQNADFAFWAQQIFLTGIGASGLPVTLLSMEQAAGGERS